MFDHLGLHVKNLTKSSRFYEAALAPLGYTVGSRDATSVSFTGPPGAPALYLYLSKASAGEGTHLAWMAKDRSSVKRFYEGGVSAGGKDNGGPGVRADYAENYYAAFLLDPDGNNVEAVSYSE
jgi:catechol 2,3-dioxygenase-like lactoylglutathione lyase family enzyme